jgi:hypothetical protein
VGLARRHSVLQKFLCDGGLVPDLGEKIKNRFAILSSALLQADVLLYIVMDNSKKNYIYTTRRAYFIFFAFPAMLLTGAIATEHYLFAALSISVYLFLMRYVKYAHFGTSGVEVCYPLRRKNIFLEYEWITTAQFKPEAYKSPAAIKLTVKFRAKTKAFGFLIYPEQGNPILQRLKMKNRNISILKPEAPSEW